MASAISTALASREFTARAIARAESRTGSTLALLGDAARHGEDPVLRARRVAQRVLAGEHDLGADDILALDVARRDHLRGRCHVRGVELAERVDEREELAELRPEGRNLSVAQSQPRQARDVADIDPIRRHDPACFALPG